MNLHDWECCEKTCEVCVINHWTIDYEQWTFLPAKYCWKIADQTIYAMHSNIVMKAMMKSD